MPGSRQQAARWHVWMTAEQLDSACLDHTGMMQAEPQRRSLSRRRSPRPSSSRARFEGLQHHERLLPRHNAHDLRKFVALGIRPI